MLYILLTKKVSQVFHFFPFPCVPWPKLVFPPIHPALLGDTGDRIPLSLHIWNKMSANSYPRLFIAGDVRGRTEVDLISGPACRHLRAISGKLRPNFPSFRDEESSHFFSSHSFLPLALVNFHLSTSFRTITLLERIRPLLQKKFLLLSNQGGIGMIEMYMLPLELLFPWYDPFENIVSSEVSICFIVSQQTVSFITIPLCPSHTPNILLLLYSFLSKFYLSTK